LIGVNNRDLRDFTVDLGRTETLARLMPAGTQIVAESGLAAKADLDRLAEAGVHRFLVGETLMRQADVAAATSLLLTGA
jgi:indole-3-glycerol phosphate synthase